ncbi:MAG: nicotinate-nucleotide adenylyltransferase [Bacteroidetes bacterium]|nr:nicotinate-nucleotide adenylyltransferase [Bacteroidota bacterium]MBU1114253.1 nicotinate-nucleotide adenylyltransferase [Bacteroidota bacterium]MBU1797683.1 nicotinate-nucleotide adenylyltransferase [Bacteroidota bacterium]
MKKIGIYGGNFDPIHLGHLITARSVKELRNLSEIIFVPANTSPLKQEVESTSTIHRFAMTKLAVEKYSDFRVSDFEIKKNGVSFSIDTIKHFKKIYKNIELIIGYDNFLVFDKWYKWEEILELVDVIVLRRFFERPIEPKIKADKFIFVDSPTIEINSTTIRERSLNNLPIDLLVTPEVLNYIKENNLYSRQNEF